MTRMPWGRYKNLPLDEVPASYLAWLLEEGDKVPRTLREAMCVELGDRFGYDGAPVTIAVPLRPPADLQPALADMLRAGYAAVARQVHPDIGGSTAHMQTVNQARDWARTHGLMP